MLRLTLIATILLLLQAVASARTVSRSSVVRVNGRVLIINNPVITQTQPRVEKPDHWDAARASYFQRMYGNGYCR